MKSILARALEALHVLGEAEDRGTVGGLVAADALEDAGAVVEGVRQDVYLRLVPVDELAVHPDLVHGRQRHRAHPSRFRP